MAALQWCNAAAIWLPHTVTEQVTVQATGAAIPAGYIFGSVTPFCP